MNRLARHPDISSAAMQDSSIEKSLQKTEVLIKCFDPKGVTNDAPSSEEIMKRMKCLAELGKDVLMTYQKLTVDPDVENACAASKTVHGAVETLAKTIVEKT